MDIIGVELTELDKLIGLDDDKVSRHSHIVLRMTVEPSEMQVARLVRFVCVQKGNVGADGQLQQIILPVHGDDLLSFGNDGSDAGGRQDTAETVSAGAYSFCKGALRNKLHLKLTGIHLRYSIGIHAKVGRDALFDLMIGDESAETGVRLPAAGRDRSKALDVLFDQTGNYLSRGKHAVEICKHDRLPVMKLFKNFFKRKYFVFQAYVLSFSYV